MFHHYIQQVSPGAGSCNSFDSQRRNASPLRFLLLSIIWNMWSQVHVQWVIVHLFVKTQNIT